MKFESFPKPKSKEELKKQAKLAEKVLGKGMYPPDRSESGGLDISTIKEKYKTRYDAYVTTLRRLRQGELNTKEIQHAKEWITALNNLDTYIKEHESHENPLLREKQYIVYKKIRDFLEQGKRKGYIKLPTGTGKTILFVKIAEALGMRTLVASPSIIILGQNARETEQFTDSEFGEYHGLEKDLSGQVTHITYHSLVNAVRDGKINPEDIPVLILDEAHRSLGPERAQTIKKFEGLQLGFTATSEFSMDRKVAGLLEEEIFRMDVAEGIQEGLIANTQTIHAYTAIDLSSVAIRAGKYDQEQLEKVTNVLGRNMGALDLYKKKFSHLKAICNCSGVKHAQDVARLFNEKGVPSACITGSTPKEERIIILEDYKNGNIKVLANARVLLEGFNEPSCSVTFNLHPTLSLVDAEQRARSGRLDKNNPKKWSYVVDFIDQNPKKPQVLYSEILRGDRVWNISKPDPVDTITEEGALSEKTQESKPPINLDDFSLDGLKVVVNAQNIMEVTNRNLDFREEWTFETLQADVRLKGIKSSEDYTKKYSQYNWPAFLALTSMSQFPKNSDGSNDWKSFLGLEKFNFEKFRSEVIAKGISSTKDLADNQAKNNWPSFNRLISMPEFPRQSDGSNNWDKFFMRAEKQNWSYSSLRKDVIQKGIKTSKDYKRNNTKNNWPGLISLTNMSEFPKNPDGSNDWDKFLGRKKKS